MTGLNPAPFGQGEHSETTESLGYRKPLFLAVGGATAMCVLFL